MWQETHTGTVNGRPVKAEVINTCLMLEDTKDFVNYLVSIMTTELSMLKLKPKPKRLQLQCKMLDPKETGNAVSLGVRCRIRKEASLDMATTFKFIDSRHFTSRAKWTFIAAGRKIVTTDRTTEGRWISATCTQ